MLTIKTLYSLVAIADIAKNCKTEPVRLQDVARRQDISVHYLEQLARKLRLANIIVSVRGPGGGYRISDEFKNKTVKDVLIACEERVIKSDVHTLVSGSKESNTAQRIVKSLNVAVVDTSADVTLASLAV